MEKITWNQMYIECQGQHGSIHTAKGGTITIITPTTGYSTGTTYVVDSREPQYVLVNPEEPGETEGEADFEAYWKLRMSPEKGTRLTAEEVEQLKKRSAETWIV
jgi:hypothetical protein